MQNITILCYLLMFINLPVLGQNQMYSIRGVLRGLGNEKVYLGNKGSGYSNTSKLKVIDSCYSKADTFYFQGRLTEPDFYSIEIPSMANNWATFILENSEYKINGHIDSLSDLAIVGALQQTAYLHYKNFIDKPFYKKYFFYKEKIEDNNTSTLYKDSLDILLKEFNVDFLDFIRSNPKMFIGLHELYSYAGMKMLSDSIQIASFKSLSPELQQRGIKKGIYVRFDGGLKAGDYLPDFTMDDRNGRKFTLSTSTHNRKYILVDFWASWCIPCIEELNKISQWYNNINTSTFDIVAVSIDVERKNWLNAVDRHQYPWIQVSDLMGASSTFFNKCGIRSIPQNFLIDQNRKIIQVNINSEQLLNFLKEHRL